MPRSAHGRRALRARVARELRTLGDSRDDVAQRLEALGVRGTPGNVSDCAIAVYLSSIVGADPLVKTVLVGSERVFVKLEGRWLFVGVSLPKPLRRFVAEFDREAYPALVRPPAEGAWSVATSAPSGA